MPSPTYLPRGPMSFDDSIRYRERLMDLSALRVSR